MWKVEEREKKKRKKKPSQTALGRLPLFSAGWKKKKKGKAKSSADIHLHGVSRFFSSLPPSAPCVFSFRSVFCCRFTHEGEQVGGAKRGRHGLRVRATPSKVKRHVHTSALYRANKKLFFFSPLLHFGKAKFDDDLKMREREKKRHKKA